MDFSLTPEQIQLRDTVREFAAREVAPYIQEWDAKGQFHPEVLRTMGELGILGLPVPEEYGGSGFDYVALALACEELEYVDTFLRVVMSVHVGLNSLALLQWGDEEQKQRFLVPQARGEKFGTFALTEPNAGSDAGSIESTYVRDGDAYVLNGAKMWISLADFADHFLVFASFDRGKKHNGLTAFMLERGMPGLTTGTIKGKLGVRAGNTGELAFNNVRIPIENRIGEEGEGFKIAMSCIDQGRFTVGAGAVGLIRACLDASTRYANERFAFGQEIGRFELVKQMIAKMVAGYEASRLLTMQAAESEESGHPQHARDVPDEVVWLRRRAGSGKRRHPDPRVIWLFQRIPGRALLAERTRRGDLRGHAGDPHHPASGLRPWLSAGQATPLSAATRGGFRAPGRAHPGSGALGARPGPKSVASEFNRTVAHALARCMKGFPMVALITEPQLRPY